MENKLKKTVDESRLASTGADIVGQQLLECAVHSIPQRCTSCSQTRSRKISFLRSSKFSQRRRRRSSNGKRISCFSRFTKENDLKELSRISGEKASHNHPNTQGWPSNQPNKPKSQACTETCLLICRIKYSTHNQGIKSQQSTKASDLNASHSQLPWHIGRTDWCLGQRMAEHEFLVKQMTHPSHEQKTSIKKPALVNREAPYDLRSLD